MLAPGSVSGVERWWVGLRSAEAAQYVARGRRFTDDEVDYRRGFEASLRGGWRGRAWDEVVDEVRARYPDAWTNEAFRRGWERGRRHDDAIRHSRRVA